MALTESFSEAFSLSNASIRLVPTTEACEEDGDGSGEWLCDLEDDGH